MRAGRRVDVAAGPALTAQPMEAIQAVAQILERADLVRLQGARLERREAKLADALSGSFQNCL